MISNQNVAYRYAIAAVLCWSSVSTAFKISLRYLTPLGLLLFSSLTAAFFLSVYALITDKNKFLSEGWAKLYRSIIPGFLNPFLYYLVLFEAYNRILAQEAQVLNYTWAIVLPLMSIIVLKHRLKLKDIGGLLVGFIGVILIATRGDVFSLVFDDWFGSLLAVGSSFIWAAYWLINLKDRRKPAVKLSGNFLIGVLFILTYYLIRLSLGEEMLLFTNHRLCLSAIICAFYVGIFEMGLTFLLWFKALMLSQNMALVSNLIFFTPFISLFLIQIVLNESIHYATVGGLVMIVIGNIIQKSRICHRNA